jgi:hypothetical protein
MKSLKLIRVTRFIVYFVMVVFIVLILVTIWNITKLVTNPDYKPITLHTSVIRLKSDVYIELKEDLLKNDTNVYSKVARNKSLYDSLRGTVVISLILAVLFQLKTLINSFEKETLFKSENIRPVRKISYLLLIWIIVDLAFYLCIPLFIPSNVISNTYNFWPIKGNAFNLTVGIFTLLASINYGVLLSAFAFYVISIVYKEGNLLKEQADLTI